MNNSRQYEPRQYEAMQDKPFWVVQAVFDPDGTGHDFAYTVGLASRGREELHLWARPTNSEDPGADFKLSTSDCIGALNDFARPWLSGDLTIGDTRTVELDEGMATATFTVGEPQDADDLEAFGARPSRVVPLRWSLERLPRSEPVPLTPAAEQSYVARIRALSSTIDTDVRVLGAGAPGEVSFTVGQAYGPLTTWVFANARAMASFAQPSVMLRNFIDADSAAPPSYLISLLRAHARTCGRDEQLVAIERLSEAVVEQLVHKRRWRDCARAEAEAAGVSVKTVDKAMREIAFYGVRASLAACALEDVAPADLFRQSLGAWQATLSPTGRLPEDQWRCPRWVARELGVAFAGLDNVELHVLADKVDDVLEEVLGHDGSKIFGQAITTASAPPPPEQLLPATYVAELIACRRLIPIVELSMVLAVALTGHDGTGHDEKGGELVVRLAEVLEDDLPDLADTLLEMEAA